MSKKITKDHLKNIIMEEFVELLEQGQVPASGDSLAGKTAFQPPQKDPLAGKTTAQPQQAAGGTVPAAALVNIKKQDIDFYANGVTVLGKGSKERFVPFGAYCRQSIENYLEHCPLLKGLDPSIWKYESSRQI